MIIWIMTWNNTMLYITLITSISGDQHIVYPALIDGNCQLPYHVGLITYVDHVSIICLVQTIFMYA